MSENSDMWDNPTSPQAGAKPSTGSATMAKGVVRGAEGQISGAWTRLGGDLVVDVGGRLGPAG